MSIAGLSSITDTFEVIPGETEFIAKVKGASSRVFNQRFEEEKFLMWQEGYGVITVRKGESEKVVGYIQNQQEIHAKRKASRLLETMTAD